MPNSISSECGAATTRKGGSQCGGAPLCGSPARPHLRGQATPAIRHVSRSKTVEQQNVPLQFKLCESTGHQRSTSAVYCSTHRSLNYSPPCSLDPLVHGTRPRQTVAGRCFSLFNYARYYILRFFTPVTRLATTIRRQSRLKRCARQRTNEGYDDSS